MAQDSLQQRVETSYDVQIDLYDPKDIISYEVIETHKVRGRYEIWRIRKAKNIKTGTSYWCYLKTIR